MLGTYTRSFVRFWKNQKGATAIEYGFIAVLISLGALAAFSALGDSLSNVFSSLNSNVEDATPGGRGGSVDANLAG